MARSQDRRPGYSRRAQYGIFTGYVIAILGVVAGLAVLVTSLVNPDAFAFARSSAAEVARPLGKAGAEGRSTGQGLFAAVGAYFRAGQQNADLRREVEAARANAVTMQSLQDENRRLKALLGIVDPSRRPIAAAHLIGSTAASTRRFAIIDVGTDRGVRPGQPVRAASGLVGRVIEAGPSTARVLLVTDPDNVVPVRRVRDGLAAFVQGASNGRIDIRLINMGINPVRKGDVFVTSGSGGLYPPGIPVAVATDPHRDGATGHLAADPADNEFVIVEPTYSAQARAEIEQIEKDGAQSAAEVP
ncbi:rod shape-determining protein MreC [Novosphingobium aromaticivorans DSM 12444]|uniref:Cell shape-determining protein MreC n=1 Tax=Novosphingobium aromaticivorans (strain ATCC 700278 / DSM 12444 / CCUG 56034 / CIP 105152 / NBRC 16084 / F199) TaxID=279238 RepID=Q2G6F5_NOVAD|nr:rod shape-determining protein MreC [Novosphingobium aromaticivorans]ABD26568.1 rod shape-determining protein MreC [Novosphingobium aromaticivorans DSM 12444]SCY75492.1 rod shape-determining protein MreC [Novosphingobium aromaticivorans]